MTDATANNELASAAARKVGAALGIAIFVLPWIFAWFLLRRGYSNTARLIAFSWMIVTAILAIVGGGEPDQLATANSTPPSVAREDAAPEESVSLTGPQKNAVRSAKQYLSISGFSRQGLIDQLSSSAGDGYDEADASAAVDSLDVDWNANAVKSAKQYLSISGFSCDGLIEQLSSNAGDKYTVSQATYGARQAGAC